MKRFNVTTPHSHSICQGRENNCCYSDNNNNSNNEITSERQYYKNALNGILLKAIQYKKNGEGTKGKVSLFHDPFLC